MSYSDINLSPDGKRSRFLLAVPCAILLGFMSATATAAEIQFSTKGGLKAETDDGNFKAQVGGRIQVDGAYYDDDKTPLGSGTEFRRIRLFSSGSFFKVWDYKAQFDFADGAEVKDGYLKYKGLENVGITIGQYKEPFSLEELTSSKYITFMERSLPVEAFAPSRKIGIGTETYGDSWSFEVGFFGEEFDVDVDEEGNEGYGVSGRVTFAPINEETRLVHLGVSAEYRDPQDTTVRFRARPESHITGERLVDTTGMSGVDDIVSLGVEAAAVFGPFSVQGEYIRADVSGGTLDIGEDDAPILVDTGDPAFAGWYVYGSYFLTGESRPYQTKKRAAFQRVKPNNNFPRGPGAWEIAVRYSTLDLDDGAINGGEQDDITVGLNWYPNPHVRFMANYVMANADPNSSGVQDEPNIVQFRAQIDF